MRPQSPRALLRLLTRCSLAALTLATLTGCHSHLISIDVYNATSQPVSLIEVDYPSASFGVDSLAAGATYHYRFKILGSGPVKLLWTDPTQHNHTATGPNLTEGQEGTLSATIDGPTATWQSSLRKN